MHKVVSSMVTLLFVGMFFIVSFGSVLASPLVENTWTSKAPMQHPRYGLGVVAVEGKIYAIGGSTMGGELVGTTEVYDPVSDTWTTLASMSTPRKNFAAVAYQNKIYCIGGVVGTIHYEIPDIHFDFSVRDWVDSYPGTKEDLSGVVEVYDTTTNSWSTMTSMPHQAGHLQANVVNGQIFVLAGSALFMYNPATDSWFSRANMPATPMSDRVSPLRLYEDSEPYPVLFVINNTIIVTGKFEIGSKIAPKVMFMILKLMFGMKKK